jgi:hypothetical protein
VEPGVEVGLERLDRLVERLAHLGLEEFLEHRAVEALGARRSGGLRAQS